MDETTNIENEWGANTKYIVYKMFVIAAAMLFIFVACSEPSYIEECFDTAFGYSSIVSNDSSCNEITQATNRASSYEIAVEPTFTSAGYFSEGLAAVSTSDWLGWPRLDSFIDTYGNLLISLGDVHVSSFRGGIARVLPLSYGDTRGVFIDQNGNVVFEFYSTGGSGDMFSRFYSEEGVVVRSQSRNNIEWRITMPVFTAGLFSLNDDEIIPFGIYETIASFSHGLAAVQGVRDWEDFRNLGQWGFVNFSGNEVIPLQFDRVGHFSEGLAMVQLGDMAGFIDRDGNLAIPMRFDSARDFSEGLAAVLVDGLWGYINHAGCMVIAPQFEVAGDFSQGRATVGELVVLEFQPLEYDAIYELSNRSPIVETRNLGYIDTTGEWAIPKQFNWAPPFEYGVAVVTRYVPAEYGLGIYKSNVAGYLEFWGPRGIYWRQHSVIDLNGEIIVPFGYYDTIAAFAEGYAVVVRDRMFGLIDTQSREIVPPRFDELRNVSEGMAAFRHELRWGFIALRYTHVQ